MPVLLLEPEDEEFLTWTQYDQDMYDEYVNRQRDIADADWAWTGRY